MRASPTLTFGERVAAIAALLPKPRRSKPARDEHPVVAALARAGRPLSNGELAKALGCSESHSSKLRRQACERVVTFRRGRRVYAALPGWKVQ